MRGRKTITPGMYSSLIEGFRMFPGSQPKAAAYAGLTKNTAAKLWHVGAPKHGYRPIKTVIEEENAIVRALRQASEERTKAAQELAIAQERARLLLEEGTAEAKAIRAQAVRDAEARANAAEIDAAQRLKDLNERAGVDALQQRAEEALMIKASRGLVTQGHRFALTAFKGAEVLANRIAMMAMDEKITLRNAMLIFQQFTRAAHLLSKASHHVIETDRLFTGDPTAVIEIRDSSAPQTLEDAAQAVEHAAALLEVAQRREAQRLAAAAAAGPGSNGHSKGNGTPN